MANISIKKNFIMNALLTMSSILFPLITFPYVSRILLPEGMGKIALATSVISYFSMFAQLGIPTYGIRACSQIRDDREKLSRTAQELLIINLIMNLVVYVAFFASLITIPKLRNEKLLYCIVSTTILLTSIGMEWLYKAMEKYTYITVRSVSFKCIAVAFMFILVHSRDDYIIYGGISIFAASASNILNFLNAHKYIDFTRFDSYDLKRHLEPIFVFFAITCATTIYTHVDTVMLGFMTTDADVGYYDAAIKIKTILVSFITSLGAVLLPRSSYYVQNGQLDEFWRISKKALNFILLSAFPIFVFFILYAKNTIFTLSGKAYEASILPMQILMPTLLLIGTTNILGMQILVPTNREKLVLYSVMVGAIVDVIINVILIPEMASAGAAIGTLVAEAIVLIFQMFMLKDKIHVLFSNIHYVRIVLAVVLCSLASIVIIRLGFNDILTLIIGAVIYFGIYGICMIIMKEPLVIELLKLVPIIKHHL